MKTKSKECIFEKDKLYSHTRMSLPIRNMPKSNFFTKFFFHAKIIRMIYFVTISFTLFLIFSLQVCINMPTICNLQFNILNVTGSINSWNCCTICTHFECIIYNYSREKCMTFTSLFQEVEKDFLFQIYTLYNIMYIL